MSTILFLVSVVTSVFAVIIWVVFLLPKFDPSPEDAIKYLAIISVVSLMVGWGVKLL